MGGACCKSAPEFNPDGSEKDPQSEEQRDQDPADLRRWAKDGDAGEVERLLKRMPRKQIQSGAKKSENPEEEGHTALHFAAARGSLPCVELLVLYGSAVNARGAGGATPLHTALEAGKRQIAHFLLEHGADINATDKSGASPFLAVLVSGRKRLSTWLLQRCGSDLSHGATDKAGLTAAAAVARNGWWDFLEKLAAAAGGEAPTALNTRSAEGDTPLGWALKYGAAGLLSGDVLTGVVNKLLEAGASPMVPAFKEQIPPLCLAAATGSLPVLAALRSKGGELDPAVCVDSLRRNALHYAAAKGHKEMAALLMAEGGPGMAAHVTDAAGNTPLHLAALRGHADVSQTLLEKAEDKSAAILTANREGVSVYHLMLQAGPEDRSQRGVLWILRMGHTRAFSSGAQAPVRDLWHVLVRRDMSHPNIPTQHVLPGGSPSSSGRLLTFPSRKKHPLYALGNGLGLHGCLMRPRRKFPAHRDETLATVGTDDRP